MKEWMKKKNETGTSGSVLDLNFKSNYELVKENKLTKKEMWKTKLTLEEKKSKL